MKKVIIGIACVLSFVTLIIELVRVRLEFQEYKNLTSEIIRQNGVYQKISLEANLNTGRIIELLDCERENNEYKVKLVKR